MALERLEHVPLESRAQWRAWLERHHATSPGVWVVTYKKAARRPSPSYDEIVLEALCFGWIDSKPGKVDDERTKLYVCPRSRGSVWSAANKARVEPLLAAGLMTPAGQALIDRARADGSWNTLDRSDALEVPPALASAFDAHPGSEERFNAFPPGVRRQLLFWVESAKTADTRARRVDEIARLAQQNVRANQWRPKA